MSATRKITPAEVPSPSLSKAKEVHWGPSQRQIAHLALVAMGFDPTEFGLTTEDRALRGLTDIEIRKMLDPGHAQNASS